MDKDNRPRRDSEVSEQSVVADVEENVVLSTSKPPELQWQETLINLVTTQQEQLAELTRKSMMATISRDTPTPSCSGSSTQASFGFAMFKLTSYDPDKSAYSIEEWLDDATKLKAELSISDNLMIAKASEANSTAQCFSLEKIQDLQYLGDAPVADNFVDLDKAIGEARGRIRITAEKRAQHFDATRYRSSLFTIGDLVAVADSQLAGGGKLKPKFKGPFVVRNLLPNDRYALQMQGGGRRTTVAAHEQLRRWPSVE